MSYDKFVDDDMNGWFIWFGKWCLLVVGLAKEMGKAVTGRLNNGLPQVPPAKLPSELTSFQHSLPIYQMKDVITKAINDNRVLMISGETGSGKTTQARHYCLVPCDIVYIV